MKMLKRIFFFFIVFACSLAARSQSYPSIFGTTSTRWNVTYLWLDNTVNDTIAVQKDTVVNGQTWKKIVELSSGNFFRGGLLREDLITGKVFYKGLVAPDTNIRVAVNFALNKGDTFNISNGSQVYPAALIIVDTVLISGGRRQIIFKAPVSTQLQLPGKVAFIEGIGCTLGPQYKDSLPGIFRPVLLCSYKDGMQVFTNDAYNNQCKLLTAVDEPGMTESLQVYPNPFHDRVMINNDNNQWKTFELFDVSGRRLFSGKVGNVIETAAILPGQYYLLLRTRKGEQKVIKLVKTIVN